MSGGSSAQRTMRVRFRMQCRVPGPDGDEQISECELVERIPFAPRVGDRIQITPKDVHRVVGEVLWSIRTPAEFTVYFREQETVDHDLNLPWLPDLQPEGWKEA